MCRGLIAGSIVGLACLCAAGAAADRGVGGTASAGAGSGGARVALVIGNSGYASAPLRNPVNDAKAVADALQACGFDVTVKTDCDLETMEKAVAAFGERIRGANAALFYYAGHGIQVNGENYLVPVTAEPESEDEVKFRCTNVGLVLAKMKNSGASVNLLILDACRNNPFARSFRSAAQGLATMEAAKGVLVAYATAPGAVAADGDGRNSVYTASLVQYLRQPGLPVEEVFKSVRADVSRQTNDAQIPWENTSLVGQFYFAVPQSTATTAALPPPPDAAPLVGGLQVSVNAPRATVYVDGKESGTATSSKPFEQSNLPAGTAQVTVRAEGYEEFSEVVNIEPSKWTQKPVVLAKTSVVRPPAPPRDPMGPVAVHTAVVLNNILFDADSATLRPEGKREIDKIVLEFRKHPKDTVVFIGHTSNIGSDEENMKLGQRRANAVKAYMVQSGISANRVTAISKGESEPAVANDTPANQALNNRVSSAITAVD